MKLTDTQKEFINRWKHLVVNTGGNDVIELAERTGVDIMTNAPVALLQSCVRSQIILLLKLQNEGILS